MERQSGQITAYPKPLTLAFMVHSISIAHPVYVRLCQDACSYNWHSLSRSGHRPPRGCELHMVLHVACGIAAPNPSTAIEFDTQKHVKRPGNSQKSWSELLWRPASGCSLWSLCFSSCRCTTGESNCLGPRQNYIKPTHTRCKFYMEMDPDRSLWWN